MPILERKERVSDEIPTASLADIAFLLLIFFLTTTVFNEERGLPIVLPEEQQQQEVASDNLLFLLVQQNGEVVIRRGESEQTQTIPANQKKQLEGIVRQELQANENLIIAIKTDPNAPYRHMIDVLDEVKLADADRVSLQMIE
jgi:biopolymer transport protein ExbD